jgi:hypothetical protein
VPKLKLKLKDGGVLKGRLKYEASRLVPAQKFKLTGNWNPNGFRCTNQAQVDGALRNYEWNGTKSGNNFTRTYQSPGYSTGTFTFTHINKVAEFFDSDISE